VSKGSLGNRVVYIIEQFKRGEREVFDKIIFCERHLVTLAILEPLNLEF